MGFGDLGEIFTAFNQTFEGVAIGLTGNQDMSGTCSCHDKAPSVVLSNEFIGFSRFKIFCPISANG
jgi:hypothetical protein